MRNDGRKTYRGIVTEYEDSSMSSTGCVCDANECYAHTKIEGFANSHYPLHGDGPFRFCPEHAAQADAYVDFAATPSKRVVLPQFSVVPHLSGDAERQNRFASHQVNAAQAADMDGVRHECLRLAERLAKVVPAGREQATALTNLEQVMFWANAGIARTTPA